MADPRPTVLIDAVMGPAFGEAPGLPSWRLLHALEQSSRGGAMPLTGRARRVAGAGGHRSTAYAGAVAGRDEAFVKIITKGGTHTLDELKTQVAYVGREGEVSFFGPERCEDDGPLTGAEVAGKMEAWAEGWRRRLKHGQTIHMVVSFPRESAPEAVLAAGRAFAETAFGSGYYGDRWDFLAALHTDKAHPHVHILVNRRGLESETLLNTHKASVLNLDRLREIQVEMAAEQGIDLVATSRLARGITDLAPGVRDYRRAMAAAIHIHCRSRSGAALAYAHREMQVHAANYERVAEIFDRTGKTRQGDALFDAADILRKGGEIMGHPKAFKAEDFQSLEAARGQIATALARAERHVEAIQDPREKAMKEVALADVKAKAAPYLPERADLRVYTRLAPVELHRSRDLDQAEAQVGARADPRATSILAEAKAGVRRAASEIGLDGATFVARYSAKGDKDAGLTAAWAAEDMASIMRHAQVDPRAATDQDRRSAAARLDQLHSASETAFRRAAARITLAVGVNRGSQASADQPQDRNGARDLSDPRSARQAGQDRIGAQTGTQTGTQTGADPEQAAERAHIARQAEKARQIIAETRTRPRTATEDADLRGFISDVSNALASRDLAKVERGEAEGMEKLATPARRAAVTRAYLEARHEIAGEREKQSLRTPLDRARTADVQEQVRQRSAAKGRDRDEREL